jgi:hypothetical protein
VTLQHVEHAMRGAGQHTVLPRAPRREAALADRAR